MLKLTKQDIPEIFTQLKEELQRNREMSSFAKGTGIERVNLYGILKNQHKPSCDKFIDIMNEAGYDIILSKRSI